MLKRDNVEKKFVLYFYYCHAIPIAVPVRFLVNMYLLDLALSPEEDLRKKQLAFKAQTREAAAAKKSNRNLRRSRKQLRKQRRRETERQIEKQKDK